MVAAAGDGTFSLDILPVGTTDTKVASAAYDTPNKKAVLTLSDASTVDLDLSVLADSGTANATAITALQTSDTSQDASLTAMVALNLSQDTLVLANTTSNTAQDTRLTALEAITHHDPKLANLTDVDDATAVSTAGTYNLVSDGLGGYVLTATTTEAPPYTLDFVAADWNLASGGIPAINAAQHGLGTGFKHVSFFDSSGTAVSVPYAVQKSTGTVFAGEPGVLGFDGSIYISN
jgi:hypothetical protein